MPKRIFVFVGGAARTGTTLLQSLLCGLPHSGSFMPEFTPIQFLNEFLERVRQQESRFDGAFFGGEAGIDTLTKTLLVDLLDAYDPKTRDGLVIIKHPALTPSFPFISDFLDDRARFVTLVRNPCDAIGSMVRWGIRAAENNRYHWFSDRNMQALSRYFLSFYGPLLVRDDARSRFHFVRYEDLVQNHPDALEMFVEDLGYTLDDLTETDWGSVNLGVGSKVEDATSPLYGHKISANRIGAGRETLSQNEVRAIEAYCQEYCSLFGYTGTQDTSPSQHSIALEEFSSVSKPVQPVIGPAVQNAKDSVAQELSRLREALAKTH